MSKVNFHAGRTFYQSTAHGATNGWYFLARNKRIIGPYLSREALQVALQSFVKACVSVGETDGRCNRRESTT
jgi:hypothetical protein